ncbi:hypothetical protein D3C75_126490 [compost metagenome]
MLGLEIRLIMDITEAQGAGIKTVFLWRGSTGDDRTVQLRMLVNLNIIAALAGKYTGLLLHAVIIAVQFVMAHTQTPRAASTDDSHTDTTTDAALFGVIVVAILLALHYQVTAGIHLHPFATDLCP